MTLQPDELLTMLEDVAMRTSQGTFVRLDDVRRLMTEHAAEPEPAEEPAPRNVFEARAQAKRYLEKENGPADPQLGRAIPATETQSSSRT